jgi:hypothetical protein
MDDERKLIYELQVLLEKVQHSEDRVRRAIAFRETRHHNWSRGVDSYFQDWLERKREQIDYEWHLIDRLGQAIAETWGRSRDPEGD